MSNPFGKKLEYNPVPSLLQIELVGEQKSGKSTLAAKLAKPGIVVVIDSDGRFSASVPENSNCEFYPLSDHLPDMIDVNVIEKKLYAGMPQIKDKATMVIVDSATSVIEPIVNQIQRDQESGNLTKSATAFKPKAIAMKTLRHAVNHWGVDTVWIYHTDLKTDSKGNQHEGRTLSNLEIARLGRSVNLSLKVVVDDTGKRGVQVLEARQGRTGFTIWDESGTWNNFRQIIEQRVWGGLTQKDQQVIETTLPKSFVNAGMAVRWAWDNYPHLWKDAQHTQNSLKKLNEELKEQLGEELYSLDILWEKWIEKVTSKTNEHE